MKKLKIILAAGLIACLLGILAGCVSGASTKSSSDNDSSDNQSQNLTIGSTLSAKGLNITLQKVEDWNSDNMFINPKDGFKFIRAYFVLENTNSSSTKYALINLNPSYFVLENTNSSSRYLGSYDFTCYADNAKADMSIFGEDTLDLGAEVSSGRVLQGYIYYEVPVNAQSIEIEYDSDWWGNKAVFKVR